MGYHIDIITRPTPGLAADAKIIRDSLSDCSVNARVLFPRRRNFDLLHKKAATVVQGFFCREPREYINIFIEQLMPIWLSRRHLNIFIPNQEWVRPETIELLTEIDFVFCKTKYAEKIFKSKFPRVRYIGFSGVDKFIPSVKRYFDRCLHVAGRSAQKGTKTLLDIWAVHPEWPRLIVVSQNPSYQHAVLPENITLITHFVSPEEMRTLQNECGIHLCPSEAEGYGHYIAEALSCGAIVITTKAPPMDELVTPDRGFLAPYSFTRCQSLGENFYVDRDGLEGAIQAAFGLSENQRQAMSNAARAWFLENRAQFEANFPVLLHECINESGYLEKC